MHEALDAWGEIGRESDDDGFAARIEGEFPGEPGSDIHRAYHRAMPPSMLWTGLNRYWTAKTAS
jgi:hypothetical protein